MMVLLFLHTRYFDIGSPGDATPIVVGRRLESCHGRSKRVEPLSVEPSCGLLRSSNDTIF